MKLYVEIMFVIGLVILMMSLILWSVPLQALAWTVMFGPMFYEVYKLFKEIEKSHN